MRQFTRPDGYVVYEDGTISKIVRGISYRDAGKRNELSSI
jgi:hypothetical protein